MLLHLIIDKLL